MSVLLMVFAAMAKAPAPSLTDTTVTTVDGKVLAAIVGAPKGATDGVLLVHMAGRTKEEFIVLASTFLRRGLVVVAVDLRGHGASVVPGEPALTGVDWLTMVEDVRAGVALLKARGSTRVAIVGAELGANLALSVGAEDPSVASLTLLSPGLDYKGVLTADAARRYGARPILFVASRDDTYGLRSATVLDGVSPGSHTLQVFEAAGKGTRMFSKEPGLEGQILGFVTSAWTVGSTGSAPTGLEVKTETTTLQTTGPKLGEGTTPQ